MAASCQSKLTASVKLILINTSETLHRKSCDVGVDFRCRFKRGHTTHLRCQMIILIFVMSNLIIHAIIEIKQTKLELPVFQYGEDF